jgi:NAD(P)-dependent dehydrogenase (short-subunit alcohol dehydrogenase family)
MNEEGGKGMDLKLKNRSALVSGSTKGIGLAIATALAGEGARVIVTGRSEASIAAALAGIKQKHPESKLDAFAGDLADSVMAGKLVERFPAVDILVNSLGIYEPKPFAEIPDEEWVRFFQVNVMSGVRLARAYLPQMKEKNWGRIVFISSESGIQIPKEMIHYGVTKTAQLALSRGLAETCAGTGVTVNAVLPGPTRSAGVEAFVAKLSAGKPFAEFERDFFRNVRPTSLLQRFAAPEEVASLVAYLCSPLSSATNGAALRADGGVVKSCF